MLLFVDRSAVNRGAREVLREGFSENQGLHPQLPTLNTSLKPKP